MDVQPRDLEAPGADEEIGKFESKDHGTKEIGLLTQSNDSTSIPQSTGWTRPSPLNRLHTYGRKVYAQAQAKFEESYPHVLDKLRRFLKLCGLTLMIIFVVMLASWYMALSHWFTVVFGHLVLHYAVPESIDPALARAALDQTMLFAAVGAFIVNLPPFIIFLLSFPLTFDRAVIQGSTAPANDFIKRITPKNRYALIFMKYAPRLTAGPIGCQIVFWLSDPDEIKFFTLDPLHAFLAGLTGEVVLSGLGHLKDVVKRRKATSEGDSKESLPV